MPALPKPHRIAVLVPVVTIDGPDAAYEREAAILVWTALLETCSRHPRLSVLDAEATPLFPQDGHFAPQYAGRGARPSDVFFGPTRRDELVWLELALGKPGVVRLHTIGREAQESFEALGRNVGEQIDQVIGAWLTARKLGVMPRPFEAVTSDEMLAVLRAIAPTLAEQARAWTLPVAPGPTWSLALVPDEPEVERAGSRAGSDEGEAEEVGDADVLDETPAVDATIDSTLDVELPRSAAPRSIARPLVARLPQPMRVAALRLLELALREDLSEPLAAADPQRREREPDSPTALEVLAQTGMSALRRPANLDVLERAAEALADADRPDEAQRLLERAVVLHDESPRAHLALLDVHRQTHRVGAWLERALQSAAQHGCPMDPVLPWYPDQIHIDLRASTALLHAGRLDEAIALRANRLAGREASWPVQTRALEQWRSDPRFVAWCYAREGFFRGDEARAIEGFGRSEPEDSVDLAIFLDSLVAVGREDDAPLAWAQYGLGRGLTAPIARLAAAGALMAAGEWRRGMEELWRIELTAPGRDDQIAIARVGLVMSAAPLEVIETALGDRIAIGAPSLARRMARDVADFVPAAAKSGLVARALGTPPMITFDPEWLAGFSPETRSRRALDALFAELGSPRRGPPQRFDIKDELEKGDRLVNRWLEVVFAEASEDDRAALAQAAAYAAAQALGRYLAMTTAPPCTIAGALRAVAAGALALVRKHRAALSDRDARALIGTMDPLLRRVDRWIGTTWLAAVERAVGIDERSGGGVAGFVRDYPVVAARILGPEETAVLAAWVAKLHRERPDGWAAKVAAQASRLASSTGSAGVDEWADAIAAQLAAHEIELDDAIDALHTACYLADGRSAVPCVHAARVLFEAGRAPAALAMLVGGLRAAEPSWRDTQLASLAPSWKSDVPMEFAKVSAAIVEALQQGDAPRAEKLARWAVAYDHDHRDAHRSLGVALAQQGKLVDAMHHLVRGAGDAAPKLLAEVLAQAGKPDAAAAVLAYASRWYKTADEAPQPPGKPRERAFGLLEAGEHAAAADLARDASWRVRRAALHAARYRFPSENHVDATRRARAAAVAVLAETVGTMDRDALVVRALALRIREQAHFARDPVPRLGERMTRQAFYQEFRARGGFVLGDAAPPPAAFEDRVVVPGSKVARASDYIALLRELASLPPRDALAQFDLDENTYLEIARAWAVAMEHDPTIAKTIEAGLASEVHA